MKLLTLARLWVDGEADLTPFGIANHVTSQLVMPLYVTVTQGLFFPILSLPQYNTYSHTVHPPSLQQYFQSSHCVSSFIWS